MMYSDFIKEFDNLSREIHETAVKKGWWEKDEDHTKILLMHTELSEYVQASRDPEKPDKHLPHFPATYIEMADVVIRIMDFCFRHNMDLGKAIVEKSKYNKKRPYKHGGKKF